ncbi:MAG: FAD-dependent oxidoreductase [Thaumarchaeota archaeon]|nr:FAD-dependent oxidoreductase [Nitrososphaerota archaeon]
MTDRVDYLVIGGGVAGGHAVFEIRRRDKSGRIVVVNRENQFSYDRPPLSKEYLAGKMERSGVFYKTDSYYRKNKIDVIRGHDVQSIDTPRRRVTLDDGREFVYKTLLIATGGRVRKLELPGSDFEGIHYLRTIEDCDVIRKEAKPGKKVTVIGGGFIGCEVAATLRGRGLQVTVVETSSHLLSAAIDEETAGWIKEYQEKKGVRILTNATVTRLLGKNGRVNAVELKDGQVLPSDFVVAGIGIIPNTELAEDAGLKVDRGILVDSNLKASAKHVYAAGDIARFYSPVFERNLRVEHVDVAQKQGTTAGRNMTGAKQQPFDELPYFFSNQFEIEINAYGDLSKRTTTVRRGKMDIKTGFIQFYFDGTTLDGILSVNADWEEIEAAKTLVGLRKDFADPSILGDEKRTLKSIIKKTESPKGRVAHP